MSLEIWKAKYYPAPAAEVSKEDALEHSIRKWQGLKATILKRHGLKYKWTSKSIVDAQGNKLIISISSCALCLHFAKGPGSCPECPLAIARSGVSCDYTTNEELLSKKYNPWQEWILNNNHLPMLNWLLKLRKKGTTNAPQRIPVHNPTKNKRRTQSLSNPR